MNQNINTPDQTAEQTAPPEPEQLKAAVKAEAQRTAAPSHDEILDKLLEGVEEIDYQAEVHPFVPAVKAEIEELEDSLESAEEKDKEDIKRQISEKENLIRNCKVNQRHYTIICVEHILETARQNRWNLCRNLDFIYLYNGEFWKQIDKDELKAFLGKAAERSGVTKFFSRHHQFKDELFKQFLSEAYLPTPKPDTNKVCINLKNGTFEITPEGNRLRSFDPDDFLTYQLDFEYDKFATAPIFEKYLNRVLPDKQRQNVIAEYLGFAFVKNGSIKEEKVLFLYGSGANGKSVLHEVIQALLGKENTSNYSLQSLTDRSGYYRAMIGNKLINYASEISGKLESSTFKQLASCEPVDARLPYGNPMQIEHYARLIFNVNELPKEVEQTNGFFRRFLIVPFDVTIPEAEQDKELHRKIIDKELAGVFNWILSGLQRLLRQKSFSECEASDNARQQYKTESDSVKMFVSEEGFKPDAAFMPLKDIYAEYKTYCQDNGYAACGRNNFKKRMVSVGFEFTKKDIGQVVFATR